MWVWDYQISSHDAGGVSDAHALRARKVREYLENLVEMDIPDTAVEVHLTMMREHVGNVVFMADVIVHRDPRDFPYLVP